jgi:hypothetical protein
MSSGDADRRKGGAPRPATPLRRLRQDLPEVAEGREVEAPPDANESKYAPRTPGQPEARNDHPVRGPDGDRPDVNAEGGEQKRSQQSETGPDANAPVVWTGDAVRGLGLTTDIETAGAILGVGRTKAYELARTGQFPVKVLRIGKRYVVPVPAILRLLDLE